jgi:RNA polymerase sigma factor (sigma-70 family)
MIDDVRSVINDCLTGNETAWTAFFNEYASIAMNILNHLLGDLTKDQREDIVQNTFSKLLRGGLRNFRGSSEYEFLAYFRRIVLNESRTYLRSVWEWKGAVSLDKEGSWRELQRLETPDENPRPYAGEKRSEQLRTMEAALKDSPLQTKQVVLMKMEGYKDREIADMLGISLGTVASKYARIKEKMKEMLDD